MQRWWRSARATAYAGGFLAVFCPAVSSASLYCDEYDPFGPTYSAQIRLDSGDFVDERSGEMRSFIATDSIGNVDVALVSSNPPGIVHAVSAFPHISMFSPHHGEQLKGIGVAVSLTSRSEPVSIVLSVNQVCAKHFRNTFLHY
jgi:hypothetical protein